MSTLEASAAAPLHAAPTTVDLLRHGEVEGGARLCGRSDVALSAHGLQQMHAAVSGRAEWDRIISSPLRRCALFATELATRLAIPLAIEEDLQELDFGAWEGLTSAAAYAAAPQQLTTLWCDPAQATPPGGEPVSRFQARVTAAWQRLLHHHPGERLLLIGHSGSLRIILLAALGLSLDHFHRFEIGHGHRLRLQIHPPHGARLLL